MLTKAADIAITGSKNQQSETKATLGKHQIVQQNKVNLVQRNLTHAMVILWKITAEKLILRKPEMSSEMDPDESQPSKSIAHLYPRNENICTTALEQAKEQIAKFYGRTEEETEKEPGNMVRKEIV